MSEIKALPCPYCGEQPEVGGDTYAMMQRSVACINDDCFFSDSWKRPNEENDLRLWNTRAQQPREWDADTIKDAPEGRYMIRRSSDGHWSWQLYSMTTTYDWLVLGGYHGGVIVDAAFGPIPQPPC